MALLIDSIDSGLSSTTIKITFSENEVSGENIVVMAVQNSNILKTYQNLDYGFGISMYDNAGAMKNQVSDYAKELYIESTGNELEEGFNTYYDIVGNFDKRHMEQEYQSYFCLVTRR